MKENKLEVYEELCPECNGEFNRYYFCRVCEDRGKIDWIDKIKGQRKCSYCNGLGYGLGDNSTCNHCEGIGKVGYEKET